jgi:hypothetical protein
MFHNKSFILTAQEILKIIEDRTFSKVAVQSHIYFKCKCIFIIAVCHQYIRLLVAFAISFIDRLKHTLQDSSVRSSSWPGFYCFFSIVSY